MTTGRTALPGGAPVKRAKKRANSSGKRASSRAATKRKGTTSTAKSRSASASTQRAKKSKPPCKYGPRGADGYCPKKPKASKATTTKAAVSQGPVKAKKKTVGQQAKKIAQDSAIAGGKAVVRDIQKRIEDDPKGFHDALKTLAPAAAAAFKASVPIAGAVGALGAGVYLGDKAVRKLAEDRVRTVEKKLVKQYPNGLPADLRATLLKQHYDAIRKEGLIAPSKSIPTLR